MDLRLNQLAAHLDRTLAPIYVVHGDEPLLAIEAGDAIRAAARKAGCDEREIFMVEAGFRWDVFLSANANLPGATTNANAISNPWLWWPTTVRANNSPSSWPHFKIHPGARTKSAVLP